MPDEPGVRNNTPPSHPSPRTAGAQAQAGAAARARASAPSPTTDQPEASVQKNRPVDERVDEAGVAGLALLAQAAAKAHALRESEGSLRQYMQCVDAWMRSSPAKTTLLS
eukprot:scaffold91487_cov30-Tisochrysis_lutea.AAC.2